MKYCWQESEIPVQCRTCIAAGIGISFALQGSILGPILFFLIYNGCTMALRFSLGYIGFISGSSFITNMYQNGTLKILTKCAGILGLIYGW